MKKLVLAPLLALFCSCGSTTSDFVVVRSTETAIVAKEGFSSDPGVLTPAPTPDPTPGPTRRLMAFYMVGSDLETNYKVGTADLQDLVTGYTSLSTADQNRLSLVIAFGGSNKDGWRGMKIASIDQLVADAADGVFGNEGPGSYEYQADDANMGHPSSLTLFLSFVVDNFPNHQSTFVGLWDHGASYEGFGNDENFNHRPLKLTEIRDSFNNSGIGTVDLIGFDACLMASMETAVALKDNARLMLASEELEPGHGWNYRLVITRLAAATDLRDFAVNVVDDFVDSNNHSYLSDGKTLSVLDLGRVDQVSADLDTAVTGISQNILSDLTVCRAYLQAIFKSRAYSESEYGGRHSVDLHHFASLLAQGLPGGALADNLETLTDSIELMVVHTAHDGSRPNSNGVSIIPSDQESELSREEHATTGWANLAEATQLKARNDVLGPDLDSIQVDPARGVTTVFSDDNLTEVFTAYGYELRNALDPLLIPVNLQPAQETGNPNEFFSPLWDGRGVTLRIGGRSPLIVPVVEVDSYNDAQTGLRFTRYIAELDLIRPNLDYSEEPLPFDRATLTLIFDENQAFRDMAVSTYRTIFDGPDDLVGVRVADKEGFDLEIGEQVRFASRTLKVGSGLPGPRAPLGNFVTLTQAPSFQFEPLPTVDSQGRAITLSFGALATDLAGNTTLSDLQKLAP